MPCLSFQLTSIFRSNKLVCRARVTGSLSELDILDSKSLHSWTRVVPCLIIYSLIAFALVISLLHSSSVKTLINL